MTKSVSDIGEFGLIKRIQEILPTVNNPEIIVGIGDDTAVIRKDNHKVLLLTCDIQVENQHFRLKNISPYQLGRRAMAVNLSDIAAMGGAPTFALVSLGFPKNFLTDSFDALFAGMRDELAQFGAVVIGGNLSGTEKDLIINITLIGEAEKDAFVTRNQAQPGNRIFVTGFPGGSAIGRLVLEQFDSRVPNNLTAFVEKHIQPVPRIHLGQKLAQSGWVTAMIDISDGLIADLKHICESSGVKSQVSFKNLARLLSQNMLLEHGLRNLDKFIAYGGEDYELLFTVKTNAPEEFVTELSKYFNIPITEIGVIVAENSETVLQGIEDNELDFDLKGWDHFSKEDIS